MRTTAALLSLAALLAGCHDEKASPKAQAQEERNEAVRKRSDKAFKEGLDKGTSAVREQADEVERRKAVVLGPDPVNRCTWLQSEADVRAGDQDTRKQLQAAARESAAADAMRDFLGVDIKTKTMDYQQETLRGQNQLIEQILQTTRRGREIDHKIVDEGYRDAGSCKSCLYHMTYRSCIVPLPPDGDKEFQAQLILSNQTFRDGEEAKIKVHADKDCYVYLYDVEMDGQTSLIVPNEYVREIRLKAGEEYEYPNEDARRQGIKLVAQLPEGKDVSAETVRLVVTKVPLSKERSDASSGYEGLLRRMNASRLDWFDDAQAFTIYKR